MSAAQIDAVVLAGGRGSRLGGRDKAVIPLRGERLVDRAAVAARAAGAARIVVVGPEHTGSEGVLVVREEPPFAGPLAALAAALPHVRADWLLLLSCDLVHPDAVCALLLEQLNLSDDGDGIVLRDESGRDQWLAGAYRVGALRAGLRALGGPAGAPLRKVLSGLRLRRIDAPGETTADIDDPADLERAVEGVAGGGKGLPPVERSAQRGVDTRAPGVSTRFARSTSGDGVLPVERSAQRGVDTRRADDLLIPRPKETDMSDSKHLPPQALDEWLAAAAAELGLDPGPVSIGTVLDVAHDVAHDVARPAAPLSTFLLGLAVGRSEDPDALGALAARLTARAAEWKAAGE